MQTKLFLIPLFFLISCVSQKEQSTNKISYYKIAKKARESGDSEMAIRFYDKALKQHPNDLDSLIGKAEAYIDTNRLYHATKLLSELQSKYPDNDMLHHLLGKIALINFDHKKAINEFSKSKLLKSKNALGVIYNSNKEYNKAHEYFLEVIKMKPSDPEAYNNIGMSLLELKKYNEAIFYLEKACQLQTANIIHRSNLALAYGLIKDYDKAIETYMVDYTKNIAKRRVENLKLSHAKNNTIENKIDTKIAHVSLDLKKSKVKKRNIIKRKKSEIIKYNKNVTEFNQKLEGI